MEDPWCVEVKEPTAPAPAPLLRPLDATHDTRITTEAIAALLPTLLIHTSERFRPVSIEHALKFCRWKTLRQQTTVNLQPPRIDLTPSLIHDWAHTQDLDVSATWLEPRVEALPALNQYSDWTEAPLYIQTRLTNAREGELVGTYLWSAAQPSGECWSRAPPRLLDVGVLTLSIYRYHEADPWQPGILRVPKQGMLLPVVPRCLYLEKDTHRVLLNPPSSWTAWHTHPYQPLWKPLIQRLSTATQQWIDLHNFRIEGQ